MDGDLEAPVGRLRASTLHSARQVVSYVWRHPSNRRRQFRALARAVAWQLYKRATGGYWDVRLTENRVIRCYPDSTSASCVLYAGLFDYDVMHFLLRYLRPEDNFLDVGANVGVYTILASSVITLGELHAVEPSPQAVARLKENARLNGLSNVHVHAVAAGERRGTAFLTLNRDTTNRIVMEPTSTEEVSEVDVFPIPFLVSGKTFAMGKIDIEGHEVPALLGAIEMLENLNPPVWLLEVNDESRTCACSAQDLGGLLSGFGYAPAAYQADKNSLRVDGPNWKIAQNVLFVAEAKLEEVVRKLADSRELAELFC